ncbi:biotin carboxylase N-terminal domain-containing protein [Tistrella sp.]|uniref:ATP-binding protein n=1 Tax=Tistrella sp. TaxID=2024861 RepID=UPI000C96B86A|nr:biotin carboxylase N-terminal domain-containing protein [Tistrella sp.]MAD35512.1 3-methylcrotonyl-CoA carboxylase [Tistrella sp.]
MAEPTPFSTILIANRGEIARRVIRTARRLGYRTVAVYSDADAGAAHVREADRAVRIGEAAPAASYLRIDAIIAAAKAAGADAIHPGYGFLAENAGFAGACAEAGIVFIGPSPAAIIAMGDKAGAKRVMEAAGVPCVPGYQGEDQDEARLAAEAGRIGFPVMIKATAGGGGRGMRLVEREADFPAALKSARSEAQSAFGNPDVIVEKAILSPRHVEIQVIADRHGNVLHLGERDCSVQRRHQKVIEEAPSPAVDEDLRARMGETAVQAARAIGYEGAGTLEFLLDAQGRYYFMEMNTRLQGEHPVTEAVTGLDLVELQLIAAAGQPLPITQAQVQVRGHAIEVRLCAEDPAKGFMPQSGRFRAWAPTAALRVDHALGGDPEISPYYDSMIAKVIAHGASRADACRKLIHGLEDTVALGIATNQGFLAACLAHPVFAAGQATTAFIGAHGDELLARNALADRRAAAVAALLLHGIATDGRGVAGRSLAHTLPVPVLLAIDGTATTVSIARSGPGSFTAEVDGATVALAPIELVPEADGIAGALVVTIDGTTTRLRFARDGHVLHLHLDGRPVRIDDRSFEPAHRAGEAAGDGRIRAAMNGRVVAVLAAIGDEVEPGRPLVTLEAMKMEHVHKADLAGRITAITVGDGDQVGAGQVLVEIEAPAAAG